MSDELMNTKELARFLGIHEKQVYALTSAQRIPATRITGKWMFPKKLIEEWIEENAKAGLEQAKQKTKKMDRALLTSGSNDLILDLLQTHMKRAYPEFHMFSSSVGSTEGLKVLDAGYTDIAWSHLFDPKSGEYNVPFLSEYTPHIKPIVVNLFYREMGFVVAPKNPLGFKDFHDLTRKDVRFMNRQKGSGTRTLLDYHLKDLSIPASGIKGYEKESYTHLEVGLSILSKEADVGIATVAVASLFRLAFIPIREERFDMILDQSTFFERGVQAFIEVLRSNEFRKRVAKVGNYSFRDSGKILHASK
ncbi:MAG: PBP superfamily domain protein [Syntrophorhabdaceae bacterium PtaU1.Bin034]|nr:MAG: PBP superfamily domain protein [Syntrophorhabdaceae bacterium PtaU1.Bin034]